MNQIKPSQYDGGISALRFSPDGTQLILAANRPVFEIWDIKNLRKVVTLGRVMFGAVTSEDEPTASESSGNHSSMRMSHIDLSSAIPAWKAANRDTMHPRCSGVSTGVGALSNDGRFFALSNSDGQILVWACSSGRLITKLHGHRSPITGIKFLSDNFHLVSSGEDFTLRIWDITCLERHVLRGHWGDLNGIVFSDDGKMTITRSSDDSTIRVWNSFSGRELAILRGHCAVLAEQFCQSILMDRVHSQRSPLKAFLQRGSWPILHASFDPKSDVFTVNHDWDGVPYQIEVGNSETVLRESCSNREIAWIPVALEHITTHPSGRIWAGALGNYLALFQLEGV